MQLSHLQSVSVTPQKPVPELQQWRYPPGLHSDILPLWSGNSAPHLKSPLHLLGSVKKNLLIFDCQKKRLISEKAFSLKD